MLLRHNTPLFSLGVFPQLPTLAYVPWYGGGSSHPPWCARESLWVQQFSLKKREYSLAEWIGAEKRWSRHLDQVQEPFTQCPYMEGLVLLPEYWIWSLSMILGRCQTPKTTQSAGRLPLIVSYVLISLKAYSTLYSILTYTLTYI